MPTMREPNCSTPRPFSEYCLYSPSGFSPSSSEHHYAPPRPRPRTAVKSHYRPFSTLYEDYTPESQPSPASSKSSKSSHRRSIIRPVSSGGLPAFATMGFHFKDKSKDKDLPRRNVGEMQGQQSAFPLRSNTSPVAQNQARAGLHRVKKKNSLASLFTADAVASSSTSQPTAPVHLEASSNTIQTTPISVAAKDERDSYASTNNRFVPRDSWTTRWNMKLHPYSAEAPYPQAYNPILLENDHYAYILLHRLNPNGSPSFYNYGNAPPKSALDLGCGPGYWAVDAAIIWKGCNVTAFDLVDVTLPELHALENITFVRGNFLQGPLPFSDNSFEFVRMANLSLCIPVKKWMFVLSEVHRVLSIGGRLELIDDQMFFPYGPTPVAIEPVTTPPRASKRVSILEEDFEEDLLDDDSSQISGDTESFVTSDGDTASSSCTGKQTEDPGKPSPTQLSETPTIKDIAAIDSEFPSIVRPIKLSPKDRIAQWEHHVSISRDLERRFEEILINKADTIDPHAYKFLVDLLKLLFGVKNADKLQTFQIKLAPSNMESSGLRSSVTPGKQPDGFEGSSDSQHLITTDSNVPASATKKNWMIIEWDKKEKKEKKDKKEKRKRRKTKTKDLSRNSLAMPSGSITRIDSPPAVSAKAAARLGISYSLLAEERMKIENEVTDVAKSDPVTPLPRVSVKAAKNLGLSYAGLAAATVASTRRRQPLADISSPAQSPGIVVLPSTYIPLPPMELEMHACYSVEWAETLRDENGEKLVAGHDLDDILWDYECFRRARFNWPADILANYDFPEDSWTIPSPRSATLRPADSTISSQPYNVIDDARYDHDSFTHLRTIRVYHATKSSNKLPTLDDPLTHIRDWARVLFSM
ncbi:hypothetical protein BDQ17DRAFT_1341558 [Cyathus striatus]|nr:hypothetical protein BDQ17DRAFT_1341558 [Cyathus striatus]